MCRKILWSERREMVLADLARHGGKYELFDDGAGYTGAFSKITLFCCEHGDFSTTAGKIKKGIGCPRCGKESSSRKQRKPESNVVEELAKVAPQYSFVGFPNGYRNAYSKVRRFCPEHGEFDTLIANAISKEHGCPSCAGRPSYSEEERISQIYAVSDKWKFLRFEGGYKNQYSKAVRLCDIHGEFIQRIADIIHQKQGCPGCASSGYDPNKTGFLYALLSECGRFVKIGISNKPKQRIRHLRNTTPFDFEVLGIHRDDNGAKIRMLEVYFHNTYKMASNEWGYGSFDGSTEWMLTSDPKIIPEILALCRDGVKPKVKHK